MKNDYKRDYFWIKTDSTTKENKYFFKINGDLLEVEKEVFNACYNSYKKQQREIKRDIGIELISFDDDRYTSSPLLEKISAKEDRSLLAQLELAEQVERVMNAINELRDSERDLITNILIKEKTERELAKQLNISQVAVHKRKKQIIKKIREKIMK